LLADVEAVRARGVRVVALATALTAQSTAPSGGFLCEPVQLRVLEAQLKALAPLGAPRAVKLGMVPGPGHLARLRRTIEGIFGPGPRGAKRTRWVVDPVVHTSRGERLSALKAADYLRLAGPEVVLTPNLPELEWLLGLRRPLSGVDVPLAAIRLVEEGFGAVVVKGGHAEASVIATDLLVTRGGSRRYSSTRLVRPASVRGTGCRFASALAAELVLGRSLEEAVGLARRYVRNFLKRSVL
jgi:hydroxymethylpyrimidine/phosphomethylpyrimidine kinase